MNLPEMPQDVASVCGVIVTYHPSSAKLMELVGAIRPQLSSLIIVDNGSSFDFSGLTRQYDCEIVELGENFGIAHAQNAGIERARERGTEFVLLLDQDSIPAPDMVAQLVEAYRRLTATGAKVAAVGPSYVDPRQGEAAAFVYLDGLKLRRRERRGAEPMVEADFLIASGCLVPVAVLDEVGVMVDDLFIDYVDIEWGLRARRDGYLSYGVFDARMRHALGDERIKFGSRHVPAHGPVRHYYQVRNALWLARLSWISVPWRFVLFLRVLQQFAFFGLFAQNRLTHLKMMGLGFWHGLCGRMGRK